MKRTYRIMLFTAVVGFTASTVVAQMDKLLIDPVCFLIIFAVYGLSFCLSLSKIVSISNKIVCIVLVILLLAVSPLTLYVIGFSLDPAFFFSVFLGKYMSFGSTLTILITQYATNRWAQTHNLKTDRGSYTDSCQNCGSHLMYDQPFCSKCYKLSHKIQETLDRYPAKKYLDFVVETDGDRSYCPHCKEYYSHRGEYPSFIDTPLHCCKSCKNYFIDRSFCEWPLISPWKKFVVCFGSFFCIFAVFCTFAAAYQMRSLPLAVGLLIVLFFLRVIWLHLTIKDNISASIRRVKANPDYPQLLADMGYSVMDKKYNKNKREEQ